LSVYREKKLCSFLLCNSLPYLIFTIDIPEKLTFSYTDFPEKETGSERFGSFLLNAEIANQWHKFRLY
jgi:hypothetical protein